MNKLWPDRVWDDYLYWQAQFLSLSGFTRDEVLKRIRENKKSRSNPPFKFIWKEKTEQIERAISF